MPFAGIFFRKNAADREKTFQAGRRQAPVVPHINSTVEIDPKGGRGNAYAAAVRCMSGQT